jgi:hypothetical protein
LDAALDADRRPGGARGHARLAGGRDLTGLARSARRTSSRAAHPVGGARGAVGQIGPHVHARDRRRADRLALMTRIRGHTQQACRARHARAPAADQRRAAGATVGEIVRLDAHRRARVASRDSRPARFARHRAGRGRDARHARSGRVAHASLCRTRSPPPR